MYETRGRIVPLSNGKFDLAYKKMTSTVYIIIKPIIETK